jgi:hypothetical protein
MSSVYGWWSENRLGGWTAVGGELYPAGEEKWLELRYWAGCWMVALSVWLHAGEVRRCLVSVECDCLLRKFVASLDYGRKKSWVDGFDSLECNDLCSSLWSWFSFSTL